MHENFAFSTTLEASSNNFTSTKHCKNQTNPMVPIFTLQWRMSLQASNNKRRQKHRNNLSCIINNKQIQTKKKARTKLHSANHHWKLSRTTALCFKHEWWNPKSWWTQTMQLMWMICTHFRPNSTSHHHGFVAKKKDCDNYHNNSLYTAPNQVMILLKTNDFKFSNL